MVSITLRSYINSFYKLNINFFEIMTKFKGQVKDMENRLVEAYQSDNNSKMFSTPIEIQNVELLLEYTYLVGRNKN